MNEEYIEIYGLDKTNQGRCCSLHQCCGKECIESGSIVRFIETHVMVDNKEELAVKALHKSDDGRECCVGFLPRFLLPLRSRYIPLTWKVTSLLSESDLKPAREYSFRNGGVPGCIPIEG